jgi:hypothetical protein
MENTQLKKFGLICAGIAVLIWLCRGCGCFSDSDSYSGSDNRAQSEWVGVYELSSWRFELNSDGTAYVEVDDLSYDTTWEDGGNWAVVGGMRGEVFLIAKNGDLSIRGTNGHTTNLFRLNKTKYD